MSSINPVLLFPAALEARAEALGQAYVGSLTLGAGQFCTNPGLVLGVAGPGLDRFMESAAAALGEAQAQVMLTPGIHAAFARGTEALGNHPAVEMVAQGAGGDGEGARGQAHLFTARAEAFLGNPQLAEEVFGAASLVVRADDIGQVADVLAAMEGQLTATLHMDAADYPLAAGVLPLLERKVGRILANGWPTGVEVSTAMVHGGPFPATSDPRTTSVGTAAIERFLRPVCYQDLPDALLPAAVRDGNPLGLPRMIDGAAA
jgi:NADP-dependent aldehyde dehydrogenase